MRLFIAVDLPQNIQTELKKAQECLPKTSLSLPKEFHITLKFLGEVGEEKAETLRSTLRQARFRPDRAELSGIGMFPNERHIRVIWAGISPKESLTELHESIDLLIGREYPDDHKFSPHITLARAKHIEDKHPLSEQAKKVKITPLKFEVDCFKLKRSDMSPKGPTYTDIEEYKANVYNEAQTRRKKELNHDTDIL
ncbi:RNA 2',3'-cyclic phosphodiesterase [Candidatus Woesearchaeota archaeon]|nr:RNA 2',3'-cyclic phosphodiesterase [Candidatus Woesearchaeota archaeon]